MKKLLTALSVIFFLAGCMMIGVLLLNSSEQGVWNEPVYESEMKLSAYRKIYRSLNDYKKFTFLFPEMFFLSSDEISEVAEDVYMNSPALMAYSGGNYAAGFLSFDYLTDQETLRKRKREMFEIVAQVTDQIKREMKTDYNKIQAVHDFMIDHVQYDNFLSERSEEFYESAHDAYGAIVQGIAVCDGYAKGVKLLLDELGVDSLLVYGTAREINHAWNMVKLEGEYYHVDTTWDDPDLKHIFDEKLYIYFGLNDEMISKNHTWDSKKYPVCNATKFNYYHYHQRISRSMEELTEQLASSLNSGKRTVSVLLNMSATSENLLQSAILNAIRSSGTSITKYTYVFDDDISCLTVGFIEKK